MKRTSIHNTCIIGYEIVKKPSRFINYKVSVTDVRGKSWVVYRRFSEFALFDKKLKQDGRFEVPATIPPKHYINSSTKETAKERCVALNAYVAAITATYRDGHMEFWSEPAVVDFFEVQLDPGVEETQHSKSHVQDTERKGSGQLSTDQQPISRGQW